MDFISAIVLGIVEGITEFLPVSSTGHLILAGQFFELSSGKQFVNSFEVIIQAGAVLAVVLYFFRNLWPFTGSADEKKDKWMLWAKVVVAVIPAVVLGLLFDDLIEAKLMNTVTVSIALIFYGIVFIIMEIINARRTQTEKPLTFTMAVLIGLFQCLAMVPGTSRSGATILGALILGFARRQAALFSFYLAIPTLVGAALLKTAKNGLQFSTHEWLVLGTGFVVSFVVALGVIKVFMDYIQKHDFKPFGIYRIIAGSVFLALLAAGLIS